AANYPFATIEPNVGVVPLPDERLNVLAEMFRSERVVPATVSFVDIAGIVKGASEGEGLGNQFLANIREADAICQVTRAFHDPDVVHVEGRIDPADDIETISTELILADLQTLEKAIPRLEKEVRGRKTDAAVLDTAKGAQALLEAGTLISAGAAKAGLDPEHVAAFQLMTAKPFIYVFNT
ncbi:50S ribosome-binding GTPase, partial [Georgenia sp. 10Sc9-8]|nr:50S ribosome-binding GTPase [Georgenia halotolerans]